MRLSKRMYAYVLVLMVSLFVLTGCGDSEDVISPVITVNGDSPMTIEFGSAYTDANATATDNVDGRVAVISSGRVNTGALGSYTITYIAEDSSGNKATATRVVNVVDTVAPILTVNGDSPMTIEFGSAYTDANATATDNVDGIVAVTSSGRVNTGALGSYTITYMAEDASGNSATATRVVNVVDTVEPILTVNGDSPMTIEFGSAYTDANATATDNVDGRVAVTSSGSVNTETLGSYTITYIAEDTSGNSATATRVVNVVDTVAPVIVVSGEDPINIGIDSVYTDAGATATDNVDGTVAVTSSGSVNTAALGSYTITYTAEDSSGNRATATRVVNVVADVTPPVIAVQGANPLFIVIGSEYRDANATATDNVDGTVAVTSSGSVDTETLGTYTITYTAEDAAGNSATATREVTVSRGISGRIVNYETALPVSDATITVGDQRTNTDENGTYIIPVNERTVEPGSIQSRDAERDEPLRVMVNISRLGFASTTRVVEIVENVSRLNIDILEVAFSESFDPSVGGVFEVNGTTARVEIGAGALINANGEAPSGAVVIELTPINPSLDINLMPGDMTAVGGGSLASLGAITINILDSEGNGLELVEGESMTIRIPVSTLRTGATATIPFWWFNEEIGRWVEEGQGTLSNDGTYYEASVPRVRTWNADYLYDYVTIYGCVESNSSNPIANATINLEGANYNGSTSALSDSNGNFSIRAMENAESLLTARTAYSISNTVRQFTGTSDVNMSECFVLGETDALTATLTWGENPRDLDTHVYGPNGYHVYFSHKTEGNTFLDVDDTSSFGPEVYTALRFSEAGTYHYAVYHYAGSSTIAASPTRVEVSNNGQRSIFTTSSQTNESEWWSVFDMVVDEAGNVRVVPVNTWTQPGETSLRSINNLDLTMPPKE